MITLFDVARHNDLYLVLRHKHPELDHHTADAIAMAALTHQWAIDWASVTASARLILANRCPYTIAGETRPPTPIAPEEPPQ